MSKILDTKEQGIPHSRRRWYCVGIQKKFDDGSFEFPTAIECPSIEKFLERRNTKMAAVGLPPKSATTSRGNVITWERRLAAKGRNPVEEPFIVDCDSSAERSKAMDGVCPCITTSRGAGHWVTNRGRRLQKTEMMRLQGMNPTKFHVAVSDTQLGKQLGNTMSVNVLERLFVKLLPAAKLASGKLTDRWQTGIALKELMETRGLGFKPLSAKLKHFVRKSGHKASAPSLKRCASTLAGSAAKRQR